MRKNLKETLEQNRNSLELALMNFLLRYFFISDYIDNTLKTILGSKILSNFDFKDYFSLGLLLDKIDINKFNKESKESIDIINIIRKYKNDIVEIVENLKFENKFKTIDKILDKIKKYVSEINESRKNKDSSYELSKIYKPKIDTSKLGKQGPFKKDTKGAKIRKDPYDRKFSKNKKDYLKKIDEFLISQIEKEDLLVKKNDLVADELKDEIINNLKFFYDNLDLFSEDYIEKIDYLIEKICKKINSKNTTKKEIL